MHISRKDSDSLNSIITITIDQRDYISKVEEVLKNYRKTANIPGFRKGNVPIGMIKKQYEKPVIADEVNKLLQEKLDKFIKDEKLAILGNPLPIINKDLDWTSKSLEFNFEIGLSPKFEINFNTRKKVTHFKIIADDKMINDQRDSNSNKLKTINRRMFIFTAAKAIIFFGIVTLAIAGPNGLDISITDKSFIIIFS